MKKDLLITLNFFSFFSLVTYIGKQSKFGWNFRIFLILILSFFHTTSKAQTITHPVATSNPSFPLPAGITEITVEAWGAGGAGGGALFGGGNGRSGAGGAGGAYARGVITGINTPTLNVVVGTATAGGSGNGATGGASYVAGYNSVFYAPGGRGGNANPATGPTPPAVTATTGAIGSSTTANGGASGQGYTALLGLLLSSGKGGDAGNLGTNMGGAGGAGFISLLGANEPGNPGREYGGGGAGAISTGSVQNGGSGARGHVNITYTCKPYSLTGISAANVCTAVGTTSQVQLTGTSTSLPTGTYTVTYNTSIPLATGLTETMTVAGGIGNFTARGLNTPGTSRITVTSLKSLDCPSTISANNVVDITVSGQPTITLGATTAVCTSSNVQSVTMPYSGITNSPTTYSITWNASPSNTFAAVTNATLQGGSISIPVPGGTAAGTYTGTLTVRNAIGCVSANNSFTVTVNPLPAITLGTATAVCTSASVQSVTLPYSGAVNSPTTYSITWNASPSNTFAAVTNATLQGGSISIPVPGGTAAGTYTGTLTVRNAIGCVSANNSFTVTVNPLPAITLGTATAVCTSASVQSVTLPYSGTINSPTTYSITWNASPSNTFAAVTNATLQGGSISIPVPGGTAAGTYTGTLTVRNANSCVSANNNFTITVNPLPSITLGSTTAVCTSASVQSVTLPYSGAVNSPTTYSITWNASPSNTFTAVTNATLQGGSISIPVPGGTAAGTYTGTLTVRNANSCVSANNNFTITVNPLPSITLGTATAVCTSASVQSVTIPYSGATNSPTTYSITWNASPSNSFAAVTDASLPAGSISIPVPGGTAAGTYTGSLTIKNANGCASASNTFNITVNSVSVPVASVTQQPTCINNTGVITVTSPAPGTGYTYSIDGIDFSNTTGIFSGLSSGSYDVQARNTTTGCESVAAQITINAFVTKVWNGNADANWGNPANWTPTGVPIASDCIDIPDVGVDPVISGTNGSFFASRLTIQNNGSLIVNGTNTITVTNEVNVLGNGVLTFENNSSLVQVEDVANTGNIIYKRNTTPVRRYDVTYWSSPVTRDPMFTLHDLSPNTLWDKFHKFDSASSQWIVINDGAEEMVKGNGYSIRAPQFYDLSSTQIYGGEFKGVPNNGTILGPVGVTGKLSSLGNPYPSAIYADQFISDNSSRIYGTLYFWTHNSLPTQIPGTTIYTYSSNDFAYYNLSGETEVGGMEGTPAPTPGNQSTPAGFIAAGQGFLARSLTGEPVVFTNSMRVPNLNSQFYRSSAAAAIERHRVWLNFTNELGAFKQLLIGYVTGATNSWDNSYDATTMNANPHVDFYSVNDGKKLVIQGRAVPFVVTDTIQLGYKSTIEEGEFTIAIDRTDGDLSNQDIYLQDNLTNTIHNLKTGGYTFTSAPGTFLKRFVLRYTNSNDTTLGNEDFENQDQKILVSVRDKNIRLQSVSEQENLQEVAIYDTGGKLLYVKKQLQDKEWVITNFQSGPQVLLVKITLDNGKTITRKIVFQ